MAFMVAVAPEKQTITPRGNVDSTPRKNTVSIFVLAALAFLGVNAATLCLESQGPRLLKDAIKTDLHSASITGKPESWWMAKEYLNSPPANTVLLGSSQMQCFYTTDAHDSGRDIDQVLNHRVRVLDSALQKFGSKNPSTFNASLAGSMMSDRFFVESVMFRDKCPKLVVLGIAPRDFYDNQLPSIASTEPFAFFAPFLSKDEINRDVFTDIPAKLTWQIMNRLPIRDLTKPEIDALSRLEKAPNGKEGALVQDKKPFFFGTDTTFSITPGKCLIPHKAFEGFINNNHEYQQRYKKWNDLAFNKQLDYFDRCLSDLHQQGVLVLLIGMPLDKMNSDLLMPEIWKQYQKSVRNISQKHQVTFYDLSRSDLFEHSDFADGVHLNYRGGHKIADVLAELITQGNFDNVNTKD